MHLLASISSFSMKLDKFDAVQAFFDSQYLHKSEIKNYLITSAAELNLEIQFVVGKF